MKLEAYEIIAGSNYGGWSNREMACAIVSALDDLQSDDTGILNGYVDICALYREIAELHDEDIDVSDWETEFEERVIDALPPYTYVGWQDNEYLILPDVDQCREDIEYNDLPAADELPDRGQRAGDLHAVISDHGNLSLYQWNPSRWKWDELWSVV